jgi:hypothetical protein
MRTATSSGWWVFVLVSACGSGEGGDFTSAPPRDQRLPISAPAPLDQIGQTQSVGTQLPRTDPQRIPTAHNASQAAASGGLSSEECAGLCELLSDADCGTGEQNDCRRSCDAWGQANSSYCLGFLGDYLRCFGAQSGSCEERATACALQLPESALMACND